MFDNDSEDSQVQCCLLLGAAILEFSNFSRTFVNSFALQMKISFIKFHDFSQYYMAFEIFQCSDCGSQSYFIYKIDYNALYWHQRLYYMKTKIPVTKIMLPPVSIEPLMSDFKSNTLLSGLTWHLFVRVSLQVLYIAMLYLF